MIYCIESDGYFKIGFASRSPNRRLIGLQIGSPMRLKLRWTVQGDSSDERRFHNSLQAYRERGEWFRAEGIDAADSLARLMQPVEPEQRKPKGGRRAGSGRKPIGKQRALFLADDVWDAAADRATEAGIKRPAWLRQVITEAAMKQPANDG